MESAQSNIEETYKKFRSFAIKGSKDRSRQIEALIDGLGERLVLCPGSMQESQNWTRPGGLIEQSIAVTQRMKSIKDSLNIDVPLDSLVIVGLFHNIGMVGGPNNGEDYLVPQDSDWHRKQGRLYRYSDDLQKMSIFHRSLFVLQHYNVPLTMNEWTAIAIAGGPAREENRFYLGAEPDLAILLFQARQWLHRGSCE